MRRLALLLLLSLPLSAATFDPIIVRDGHRSFTQGGDTVERDLSSLGRHYAYFERNGVAWVITDETVLRDLRRILKPQADLGREQARVGQQQAEVGSRQAAIGAQQAAIGLEQTRSVSGERARELQRRQRVLSEQQRELADEQRPLAEQQRVLAERQREAVRVARAQMERIFENAIRTGVAKRL